MFRSLCNIPMFSMRAYLVSDLGGDASPNTWFIDEDSALRAIGRRGGHGTVREHHVSYDRDHGTLTIGEPNAPQDQVPSSGTSASMASTDAG